MPEELLIWRNEGVEPPESLKDSGWEPAMKPSAQHMNWLFNQLAILASRSGVTVEDVLTSLSPTNALSANQGKVLNDKHTTLNNKVSGHMNDNVRHLEIGERDKLMKWYGAWVGDLNNVLLSGLYYSHGGTTNRPTNDASYYILHFGNTDAYAKQVAYRVTAGVGGLYNESYARTKVNNVWMPWVKMLSQEDLNLPTLTIAVLNTGWAVSIGYNLKYTKDPFGIVHLRGGVRRTSGTDNVIATLPVGYRPARQENYTINSDTGNNVVYSLAVSADGKVSSASSINETIFINISFPTTA